FGLFPALRISQSAPFQPIRQGSRSGSGTPGDHRIYPSLIVVQASISLGLLGGSGLLVWSFVSIFNVDSGFRSSQGSTARLAVSFEKFDHDRHYQFYEEVLSRLQTSPGVQSASAGWPLPMSNTNASISFNIEGRPVAKGDEPDESIGVVMPGYFETLR